MPSPWYRDGLRFECTQCGHCCTGAPGYVWVTLREIDELASFLGLGREEFARRYLRRVGRRYSLLERPNGDCVFYDRGCTVYPARPEQCRTFPFWPENLESEDAWKDAGRECPGMGKGRFYPLEEIRLIREGSGEASEGRGGSRRGTGSRAAERRSG